MYYIPNETTVKIASQMNLSSILALAHVSKLHHKVITSYCRGVGLDNMYNNSLLTGNKYSSKLLYYVFEINKISARPSEDFNKKHIQLLIQSGDLELIEWYDNKNSNTIFITNEYSFLIYAAGRGNLILIQKYFQNTDPNMYSLGLIQHFFQCYNPLAYKKLCQRAAKSGHLIVLEWLYFESCSLYKTICNDAARSGNLQMLQWCIGKGFTWDENTCTSAVKSGNLEMVIWCRKQGFSWCKNTCEQAACYGHFHILKWLRENNCPWDSWTATIGFGSRKIFSNFRTTCGGGYSTAERLRIEIFKWCIVVTTSREYSKKNKFLNDRLKKDLPIRYIRIYTNIHACELQLHTLYANPILKDRTNRSGPDDEPIIFVESCNSTEFFIL